MKNRKTLISIWKPLLFLSIKSKQVLTERREVSTLLLSSQSYEKLEKKIIRTSSIHVTC